MDTFTVCLDNGSQAPGGRHWTQQPLWAPESNCFHSETRPLRVNCSLNGCGLKDSLTLTHTVCQVAKTSQVLSKELCHVRRGGWIGHCVLPVAWALAVYFAWHFCFSTLRWEESWKDTDYWPRCFGELSWFVLTTGSPRNCLKGKGASNLFGENEMGSWDWNLGFFFFFCIARSLMFRKWLLNRYYLMRASRCIQNFISITSKSQSLVLN